MRALVRLVCVLLPLVHSSLCIRLPGMKLDKDTLTTLGIKTLGWQGEGEGDGSFSQQVSVHHNYSKVSVQNEGVTRFSQSQSSSSQSSSSTGGQTQVDEDDYLELSQQSLNLNQIETQSQHGTFGGQEQVNLEQFAQTDDDLSFGQSSNGFSQSQQQQSSFGQETLQGQDYDELSASSSSNQQIYNAHGYGDVLQLNQVMQAESDLKGQQLVEDYEDYDLGQLQLVDQSADASTNQEEHERQAKHFYPLNEPIYVHGYKYPPDQPDKAQEIRTECPEKATGQFVHADSCDKFLNCWKGRGFVQNCAPGTLFNPKTLECDFASKVQCVTGPRKDFGQNKPAAKQITEFSCPDGFSGLVPHHSDCAKFINCDNGAEHVMDCPPGTLFSLKINNCDHPYKAECASWSVQFGNVKNYGDMAAAQSGQDGSWSYGATSGTYQGGDNSNKYGQWNQNQGGSSSQFGAHQGSGQQQTDQTLHGAHVQGQTQNYYGQGQHQTGLQGQNQDQSQYAHGHNVQGQGQYQGQNQGQYVHGSQGQTQGYNQGQYLQGSSNLQGQGQYVHGSKDLQGNAQGQTQAHNEGQYLQGSSNLQGVDQGQYVHGSWDLQGNAQGQTQGHNQGQYLQGSSNLQGVTQGQYVHGTKVLQENAQGQKQGQNQGQYIYGSSTLQGGNQGQYVHGSLDRQGTSQGQTQANNQGQYLQGVNQGQNVHGNKDLQENSQGQAHGQNQGQYLHGSSNLQGVDQGQYVHGTWDVQGNSQDQTQGHTQSQYVHGSNTLQGQGQSEGQNQGQYVHGSKNLQGNSQGQTQGYNQGQYVHGSNTLQGQGNSQGEDQGQYVHGSQDLQGQGQYNQGQSNSQGLNQGQYAHGTTGQKYQQGQNVQGQAVSPSKFGGVAKCPAGVTGLYAHPSDCSKYLNCANGQSVVQDCGPGTVFNPDSKVCDFPHNVKCAARDTQAEQYGQTTHSKYQQGSDGSIDGQWQAGKTKDASSSSVYHETLDGAETGVKVGSTKCPPDASGLYPHPTICSKFLNCANGQTFIQDCGPGTVFNPASKVCDWPYNVKCGGATHGEGLIDFRSQPSSHKSQIHGEASNNQQGTYGQNQLQGSGTNKQQDGSSTHGQAGSSAGQGRYDQNVNQQGSYGHSQSTGTSGSSSSSTWTQQQNSGANQQGSYSHGQTGQEQSTNTNNQDGASGSSSSSWAQHGTSQNSGANEQGSYGQIGHSTSTDQQQQGFYGQGQSTNKNNQHGASGSSSSATSTQQNVHGANHNSGTNQQGSYGQQQGLYGQGQSTNKNSQQGASGSASSSWSQTGTTQNSGVNQQGSYGHGQSGHSTVQQQQGFYGQGQSTNKNNQYGTSGSSPSSTSTQQNFHGSSSSSSAGQGYHTQSKPQGANQGSSDDQDVQETKYFNQYGSTNKHVVVGQAGSKPHHSPAPFPSTDINADYEFGGEGALEVAPLEVSKPKVTKPFSGSRKRKDFCEASDFRCSIDDCIPQSMVCDSVKDCPDGADEQNCEKYMKAFALTPNTILAVRERERFLNISLVYCAKNCLESKGFQCKSFSYRKNDGACFLTDTNVGYSGALIISHPYNYYEVSAFTVDCTNLYKCPNQKCIDFKQVCDGINDCGDRTDERGCSAKAFGYEIRLGGTDKKHEGRIELKAFGRSGYVCDDKFGLRDADVACRELGFPLGALEVKANSYYDEGLNADDVFYLMDDVTCLGNETTLRDCDFNGWGVNNCEGQEVVGVVCKTPLGSCPKEYWKCDVAHECIPLAFMCDGVLDCTDQSDENDSHCEAPIELRLADGQSNTDGRLEIRYHGIWGTVCDDDFNDDSAKVVCKSLGYPGRAAAKKYGFYGAGKGPIWLDQVFCQGNESSLEHCVHWDWGEHNCEHGEDVGVVCSNAFDDTENQRNIKLEQRVDDVPDVLPQYLFPERCGLKKDDQFLDNDEVHFRVVKGSIAKKGDYPWQASVRIKNKSKPTHWCGAVVIAQRFVLTAAHCLSGFAKGAYFIVAGDYNTDDAEGTEQEAYIEEFYVHEEFRSGQKMNNDIALVKLKGEGFTFTKDVQPICMPDADLKYNAGLNCTISGFGTIESGKAGYSHQLRAGWIPLQSRAVCQMPHVYGSSITEGMICAGSLDGGVDACDGDSGGPLACLHDGLFTLYGLTSWGHHCGHANKPGVYVKVSHYRNWIDETMKKHS